MLGSLGFENAYALAMARKKAEALNVRSITDLACHAREFTIAGDYEIFSRPEWVALQKTYGLQFRANDRCSRSSCTKPSQAGKLT